MMILFLIPWWLFETLLFGEPLTTLKRGLLK